MSPSSRPPRRRHVSDLLLQRIVLVATLCMLILGGINVFVAYRQVRADLHQTVHMVGQNSQYMLSTALWDIETAAVQRQLDWLAGLPEVDWVRVRTTTGQLFTAGTADAMPERPAHVLDIVDNAGNSLLGTLELAPNERYFSRQVWRVVAAVIADYVIFTALICLSVSWVLYRELERPLRQIARFVTTRKPNELAQPLRIERGSDRNSADEIDLVVQGFNRMQDDLRAHIEALDEAVHSRTRQLSAALDEIKQLSQTDPLTGCFNRRLFEQRMRSEIERSKRYDSRLAVVFADIDHFKAINDAHGHAAGDEVLRVVAERLRESVRAQLDWVVRFGGEEFIIVLPERGSADAAVLAERLRRRIGERAIDLDGRAVRVTASFGVAEFQPGDDTDGLIARADAALYRAKNRGRNRVETDVETADPEPPRGADDAPAGPAAG